MNPTKIKLALELAFLYMAPGGATPDEVQQVKEALADVKDAADAANPVPKEDKPKTLEDLGYMQVEQTISEDGSRAVQTWVREE